MFGHDKQQDDTQDDNSVPVSVVPTTTDDTAAPATDAPQDELNLPAPAADEPIEDSEASTPEFIETPDAPQASDAEPTPDVELSSPAITINSSGNMKDLGSLKQEALHELSPLIGHLDQTPTEKYETAKMVYEETKDQALLTAVYEAAKNLPDDKAKAEAIYDVIKKINSTN